MFCCRKDVCLRLCIDKTCIRDFFSETPLNTDTPLMRTFWSVPLVSVLTGFHCNNNDIYNNNNNNNNNNDDSNNNNHNHNNVQCVNVMVSRLPISCLTWVYIILTVNVNVNF